MKYFLKSRAYELSLTIGITLLCFLFYTPLHDDYGSFLLSMASCQFSTFSFMNLHYLGMIGIHYLYEFFYNHFPIINWMGIAFMIFQVLGLYLFLRSVRNIALKRITNIYLVWIIQFLLALFFIENLVCLSHTRFSLLYCGIGLFNLLFTEKIRKRDIFLNSLLFIIGMLHRPESSLGMILLVSTGFLIARFDIQHLAKRIFIPVAATVILFTVITSNWQHTKIFMEKIEPEIEYKMMDKQMVDFSTMKTAEDSIKYELAPWGMWFDPYVMTPEFLRSILSPGMDLTFKHASKVFFHVISLYRYYLFAPYSIVVIIIYSFFQIAYRRRSFKILLFQTATFAIIYALDYNGILVTGRHFLSLQLISLLLILFYFFNEDTNFRSTNFSKVISILALLLIVGTDIYTVLEYKKSNWKQANETACYESAMQNIENTYHHRIIVTTMCSVYLLNHTFSIYNKNYTNNTYIMYDMFTYSLIPEYVEYLKKISGCNSLNPVKFYTWLSKQKALYLANPTRFDLTEKYMRIVHHFPLTFVNQSDLKRPDCIANTNLSDFQLCAVVANYSVEN